MLGAETPRQADTRETNRSTSRVRIVAAAIDGLVRVSPPGALVVLALMFLGVAPYLRVIWTPLYAAFAGTALILAAVDLWLNRDRLKPLIASIPILAFVATYFLWAAVVAADSRASVSTAAHGIALSAVVAIVVGAVLSEPAGLERLAGFIQVAAVVGFGVSVVQYFHPLTLLDLAHTVISPDVKAYYEKRPAALWINPNDAAVAFLLAWLAGAWARGRIKWIGRAAAVAGIYITASRTGVYLLLLAVVVEAGVFLLRWPQRRPEALRTLVAFGSGLLVAAVILPILATAAAGGATPEVLAPTAPAPARPVTADTGTPGEGSGSGGAQEPRWLVSLHGFGFFRLIDAAQAGRAPTDRSRTQLFEYWLVRGLDGPWYGAGLLSFQGNADLQGAHDLYLVVWGEAGILVLIAFAAVLGVGLARVLRSRAPPHDRLHMLVLWSTYLILGLAWHNQFANLTGLLWLILMFQLPGLWTLPARAPSPGEAAYQPASLAR